MEIFKKIDGYEHYFVGDNGTIYSSRSKKNRKTMILKMNHTSYERVVLFRDGKSKKHFVHQLVAKAFLSNPENKCCVNHKDFNGLNNKLPNIEWSTRKENAEHSAKEGRMGMDKKHLVKITLKKRKRSEDKIKKILGSNIVKFEYNHNSDGHPYTDLTLICPGCKMERTIKSHLTTITKSKGYCRKCVKLK